MTAWREILARQPTAWTPGDVHGYHTLTLGWYQNELIRRVDPRGRSLGAYFRDEIARPLDVEFYIGLPSSVPDDRVATVKGYRRIALLGNLNKLPPRMILSGMWPQSLVAKSVRCLGIDNPASVGDPEFRRVEIPSANGIGQARAIAKIYEALASGGANSGSRRRRSESWSPPRERPGRARRTRSSRSTPATTWASRARVDTCPSGHPRMPSDAPARADPSGWATRTKGLAWPMSPTRWASSCSMILARRPSATPATNPWPR